MAQYILKPSWLLPKIPDNVSYEHASLACCALGPSYRAFDEMGVNATHTVLITGIGPVGFGAITNARFRGAKVIAAELIPWRVERGKTNGGVKRSLPQPMKMLLTRFGISQRIVAVLISHSIAQGTSKHTVSALMQRVGAAQSRSSDRAVETIPLSTLARIL